MEETDANLRENPSDGKSPLYFCNLLGLSPSLHGAGRSSAPARPMFAEPLLGDRQRELVAHFRLDPCTRFTRAVVQLMPGGMPVDVVDEAHADFVVGELPLELVEVQLRRMPLCERAQFVEVIFEPVGEEQRVAVAGQAKSRAARRA